MKKVVFRKPFITRKRKEEAKFYLSLAESWSVILRYELDFNNGEITDKYVVYSGDLAKCLNKAAKLLGFRNAVDMERYKSIQ